MENYTDYSRCTLHELEDVALHIDKRRFPGRYDIVKAEIEKRRSDPGFDIYRSSMQLTVAGLIRFIFIEYGILMLLGIVWPIAYYNSPAAPATDMPVELLLVPMTALFFAFVAVCFALMRRALKPIPDRELATRQSLKAVLWAPLSCVLLTILTPVMSVVRVALAFILPFGIPAEAGIAMVLLAAAAPFGLLFWQTKRWHLD